MSRHGTRLCITGSLRTSGSGGGGHPLKELNKNTDKFEVRAASVNSCLTIVYSLFKSLLLVRQRGRVEQERTCVNKIIEKKNRRKKDYWPNSWCQDKTILEQTLRLPGECEGKNI